MADSNKTLKIVGCGCLGLAVVGIAGIIFIAIGVFGAIKKAEPYQASLKAVQSNPQAIEALGEPIEAGFLVMGSINLNNNDGDADLSYSVSGPKAEGVIEVEGKKASGNWSYDTMRLEVSDGPTIDLTPSVP